MIDSKRLSIIRKLLNHPDRQWSLPELSKESSVPKTTAWRIINKFDDRGLVSKSYKGRTEIIEIKNKKHLAKILKLSSLEQQTMKESAEEFIKQVLKLKDVKKCILFGSVARGTATLKSDIDVLIVVPMKNKGVEKEIGVIAEKVGKNNSVTIVPDIMTISEYKKLKKHESDFIKNIQKEGIKYE